MNIEKITDVQQRRDPLAEAFDDYRAKVAVFEAIPEAQIVPGSEDALVAATYGPVMERLLRSTPPAMSTRGVAEAIRFALETDSLVDRMAEAALVSALAYLDAGGSK